MIGLIDLPEDEIPVAEEGTGDAGDRCQQVRKGSQRDVQDLHAEGQNGEMHGCGDKPIGHEADKKHHAYAPVRHAELACLSTPEAGARGHAPMAIPCSVSFSCMLGVVRRHRWIDRRLRVNAKQNKHRGGFVAPGGSTK